MCVYAHHYLNSGSRKSIQRVVPQGCTALCFLLSLGVGTPHMLFFITESVWCVLCGWSDLERFDLRQREEFWNVHSLVTKCDGLGVFTHNKKGFEMSTCLWPSLTAFGCLHIIRKVLKCSFACGREFDGLEVFTHNKKGFEMCIGLWRRVWRPWGVYT